MSKSIGDERGRNKRRSPVSPVSAPVSPPADAKLARGTRNGLPRLHGDEGDTVVILESMKMEMPVEAPSAGKVEKISCAEGQAVNEGDVLYVDVPVQHVRVLSSKFKDYLTPGELALLIEMATLTTGSTSSSVA